MKKKYTPYGFDEKFEYKIYAKIGKRYYKEYNRKKVRKRSKKIIEFDKYIEWENYFAEKFSLSTNNKCNFCHYLIKELRLQQKFVDVIKTLVIPSYLAVITVMLTIYSAQGLSFHVLYLTLMWGLVMVLSISMYLLYKHSMRVDFYNDCIKVIEAKKTSHQN